ncbi:STAS/SEC14 domain-containing protein [Sphingomonas floccifaciens]|uniref:STAS/SEC14 domain-containing protein n=1 Tax=Sphingomonas floccifaciens TaxID=1844115 RepID=A0ABW4NC73_9SPHN
MLTLPQAKAYMDERQAGYAAHRVGPGHLVRMDMGDDPVQTAEVVSYMDQRVRDFPIPGRIAVVTSSAIARLQVRRVVYSIDGNRRLFEDPTAALAWLLERPAAA